jgi:hypothetical protein
MNTGDSRVQVALGDTFRRPHRDGDYFHVCGESTVRVPELLVPLGQRAKLALEPFLFHRRPLPGRAFTSTFAEADRTPSAQKSDAGIAE